MFNENTNRDLLKCVMGIKQAHDFDHGELGGGEKKKVTLINLSEMAYELSLY